MRIFNLLFLLLVLNYFSTALNFFQTLNGLACFSQTHTESKISAANVVSISPPFGSSNIDLQGFCKGGRIKHYDDNVHSGYVTNCTSDASSFKCRSHSLNSKSKKELMYSCNCLTGSDSFDPINLIITRENVFQTFNGSTTDHNVQCDVIVTVGQCSLSNGFYVKFVSATFAVTLTLFVVSLITNTHRRGFETLILMLGQKTKYFVKYGFLNYCDWYSEGRSFCEKGKGYTFVDQGPKPDLLTSFSGSGGFFSATALTGGFLLDVHMGSVERRDFLNISHEGMAILTNCLRLIIQGNKIHVGDHFISFAEILENCKKERKLKKTEFCGPLYGKPDLFDKLIYHSRCFFGFFRQDAVNQILKHNIKNPCPDEIKSSEWKLYLSDVNFHIGFRRSSKMKRYAASKGYCKYLEGLDTLNHFNNSFLSEVESNNIEELVLEKQEEKTMAMPKPDNTSEDTTADEELTQQSEDWVKNHGDFKPKIYKSDDPELLANKNLFIIDGDEAVKKSDGCFNFRKSFLEALKKDALTGPNYLRGGSITRPYKHGGLKYERVCSHGIATKDFQYKNLFPSYYKAESVGSIVKLKAPLIKRAFYGNHKGNDLAEVKSIQASVTDAITISPNPFELTEGLAELNNLLINYSKGGENESLFFYPLSGVSKEKNFDIEVLKKNIAKVELSAKNGELHKLKKERGKMGHSKSKYGRKSKRKNKRKKPVKPSMFCDEEYEFEDERADLKIVKKLCLKRSYKLKELYGKSLSFCKKLNEEILKTAEAGKPLLSANNMKYRSQKIKSWGLNNRLLSNIYKGCVKKESCLVEGYCKNKESAISASLNLDKLYRKGYVSGNVVLSMKEIISNFFNDIFFGKISLEGFMSIET